ncbi:MAG: hypothetical protein M3303_01505 [Gemmatimonadota bacterium]|nr:hypothetical protein [Gemmatimonadota bacterium]
MSSDFERDLAPATGAPAEGATARRRSFEWVEVGAEQAEEKRLKTGKYSFSQALAIIEKHRMAVQATVGVALIGRLLLEFQLFMLFIDSKRLLAAVPHIGLALLAYLMVLWFMTARTRDRYAFGMSLGIGVLQGTYGFAQVVMQRPWTFGVAFSWAVVGLAHVAMAGAAIHASTAYPPFDTKRPWIVGFATAVGLITLGWLAPLVI